ncbi:universal stress protein [Xylophilus sp. ASV27]|uniref:universal stress protein n=1 Tax=Xylophilus sp. ASV27 TaxID=2795129 RepID=UPI0018EAB699|nr:universal stress protein [Xylophilus sp. ASV27]
MYQRILVPVDGSPTSQRGLDEAIRLATLTKGRLRLIHVVDDLSFAMSMEASMGYAGDLMSVLMEKGTQLLAQAEARAQAAGVEVDVVLQDNFAASVQALVTAEAGTWPADLIVIGTHGRRGVGRALMGSCAENILRYSTVPVLLVRAQPDAPPQEAQ